MGRKRVRLWLIAIMAFWLTPAFGQAQGEPPSSGTITLVVPIAAGGGMDTIGRLVAEKLQERLKQPVVVENRVGGGSLIGINSVAKSTADGRKMLLMGGAVFVVQRV